MTASLTSVFGSRLFNELRVQVLRDEEPGLANTNDPETVVSQGAAAVLTFGRNNFSPRETTIEFGTRYRWRWMRSRRTGGRFTRVRPVERYTGRA